MKWWDRSLRFFGKVLIVLVVGTFTVTVFFPGLFTKYLQSYANRKYLNPLGLRISYSGFVGDLFSAFQFKDITIAARSGAFTMKAEDARLNIDFLRFLRRDLSFDEVSIGHLRLDVQAGDTTFPRTKIEMNRLPWISIQNLAVGEGTVTEGDTQYWFRISGDLDLAKRLNLHDAQIQMLYPELADTLHFAAKTLGFDGERFSIMTGNLRYQDNYALLDGEVGVLPDIDLNLNVLSEQFQPPEFLPDWIQWRTVEGSILGNLDTLECRLTLGMSTLGKPLDKAVLDFSLLDDVIHISRATIARGEQRITATGELDPSGVAKMDISCLNTSVDNFLPYKTHLFIDGDVSVKTRWSEAKIEELDIGLTLSELQYEEQNIRDIQGAVSMRDDIWSVTDTTTLAYAGSNIQVWGSIDYASKSLDLEVYLQSDSIPRLLGALNWIPIEGRAEGQVWANGTWNDPSLTGAVMLHNAKYQWLNVEQSFIQFILDNTRTNPSGRIYASMGNLDLGVSTVEGGEVEFFLDGDSLVANTLQLYEGFEKLETEGYAIFGDSVLFALDTLSVWRNSELLTGNLIQTVFTQGGLKITPTILDIAGGQISLSGNWRNTTDFTLLTGGSEVDLGRLLRFLGRPPKLQGTLNTQTKIHSKGGAMAVSGQVEVVQGVLDRIPFTELSSTFNLDKNRLNLDNLTVQNHDGSVHAYGSLIYAVDKSQVGKLGTLDSLDLRGSFDNYQFHDLQAHLPWRYDTDGILSGPFTARGPAKNPVYNAELAGEMPKFDRLKGDHIKGRLHYADRRLEFIDLVLETPAGRYNGYGSIPADLSPTSGILDVIKDEPVDLQFSADVSEMEFLTTYITDIDSLNGDFHVDLAITGTFERLIRDGHLSVQNGHVELFVMENPITELKGEVELTNNILQAVELTGKTPRDQGRDNSTLSVAGEMDMSRFFNPYFNVRVTGEQVYFSLPLKEIEMVGSPQLSITGRDTILFDATFEPDPGWPFFRMELTGPESYVLKEPDEGTIMVYDINVPFYSGAIVENSDIRNAEVEGEITLTRVGSEDWRYAGNIDVLSGEFVYNAYDFTIDEGWVTLDPSEFNPRYYIRATTQIEYDSDPDPEETEYELVDVTMVLTGTLDDPQYAWEIPPEIPLTESDLVTLFAIGQPLQGGIDPTITAGLNLANIVLRRFEENARQAAGLDRLRIQTASPRTIFPDPQEVRFHIGKRISPRLYIGVQADPTLSFNQYQIAYRLSRRTIPMGTVDQSVVGSVDENGLYQVKYRLKLRY